MAKDRNEPICANCGWLGARLREGNTIVEAHADYRDKLDLKHTADQSQRGGPILEKCPVCCAGVRNFEDDLGEYKTTDGSILEALHQRCPTKDFTKWQPGISPQMLLDMRMLEEQRRWQADQAEKDRVWRETESEKERVSRARRDADADTAQGVRDGAQAKRETTQHWQTLIGGSVIALVAAILGGWAGWYFSQPRTTPPATHQNATSDSSPQPPSRE